MSRIHLRSTPIASFLFVSGLLLTPLILMPDQFLGKILASRSSSKVYALVEVGKEPKSIPHDQYREEIRDCFKATDAMLWYAFLVSEAAKLDLEGVCELTTGLL
jgi:hypothetical protein